MSNNCGLRIADCGVRTKDRKTFSGLFLLICFILTIGPVYAQTVDEAVSAVEKHYQDVKDVTARTVQKILLKSVDKTQVFEGTLWIKKPGRLRLDYTNGQVILVDGKSALFYSKKSEQVVKKKFTDFEHMNIPVAFLLGAAHIRDDFEVRNTGPGKPRHLELVPKKPGAAMNKINLVSDEQGRIEQLTIFDRSGNITEIRLMHVRENTGIKDKLFTFKPPKGTEIIEQ